MNILTFQEYHQLATAALQDAGADRSTPLAGGFRLDNLLQVAENGRKVTMLEIRCDYLQQLQAFSSKADKTDLKLAFTSAYTTPLKVTMVELRHSVEDELALIMQNEKSLRGLLEDKLLPEYGFLNTVAIKLQDPFATRLLSYGEIRKMGLTVSTGSSPISVYTPTQQPFFRRGNQLLPVREATPAEQLAIVSGNLPVKKNIQYTLNWYHDIGQVRMSDHERVLLKFAYETVSYDNLLELAAQLRNEGGVQLKVAEDPMQGLTMGSVYDAEHNQVFIKSQLPLQQKMRELIDRLSEAMVTMTSTATPEVQIFERRLLALQLSARWSGNADYAATTEACRACRACQSVDTPLSLEGIMAKVNRTSRYVTSAMEEIQGAAAEEQLMAQEQAKQLTKSATMMQGGTLENFLQGIQ